MKKIVIVGNGGFAKEVFWMIKRINAIKPTWDFLGFIDRDSSNEKCVIGNDDFVCKVNEELNVVIAIGTSNIRNRLYAKYAENVNVLFPNIIDPSAIVSDRVQIGCGNIICPGAIVSVDTAIGNCSIINMGCTIGHDVVIENFVTISPGTNLSGKTHIESGCEIGAGTQTIPGIRIKSDSIIGAGAVVNKDLPSNCTAVGVPARVIKIK